MFYELNATYSYAVISENGSLTYKELKELVSGVASDLVCRQLVFCLCENSPASLIGYLACLNSKAVPLLLDKKIDKAFLNNLLSVYNPAYLHVPAAMAADFDSYSVVRENMNYVLMRHNHPEHIELYDDLALLLTTSGSTGSPKLVRQSYKNIQSNAEAIASYLKLNADERPITTLPMNYTYGLSIINSHLLVGATLLMTDSPMTMKPFWTFLNQNRATSFGGVPFIYEMLKKIRFFNMDLPSLRYLTQAGGKLPPSLHLEFATWAKEKGKDFIVMYGQTEATARMGYLPAEQSLSKIGSMGIPIPGGSFILIDTDGNAIQKSHTVGELVYEGDNVTLGYAESRSDLAKGDERGGRLVTGDMAEFDDDGFFYIVGRKKRFLKVFGNRVNLDEIDRMLATQYPDFESAAAGTDDHIRIYITDPDKLLEVKQWLTAKTHLSESAFEIIHIAEIPKNEAGKVLYKNLP